MNTCDKQKRSKIMAKIKSKDTKPELIVRQYLYAHGFRYRKNVKGLPGTPDIVLRKYKIVIFIHGCFWHGHDIDFRLPHTNTEYWISKIKKNKERDNENKKKLLNMGWGVMTIWECQLKKSIRRNTLNTIVYLISKTFLDQYRINPKKTIQY